MLLALHTPGLESDYLEPVARALDEDAVVGDYDTNTDLTGWIAQARQATAGAPCTVLGHGLGGLVAQGFAAAHSERVETLLLCSTAPSLDWLGERRMQILAALERTDPQEFLRTCHEVLPAAFADPRSTLTELFANARFDKRLFSRALQIAPPTRACTMRTLILHGRYDRLMWLEEGGQRLLDTLDDAELIVFEKSGHFPFLEQPGPFVMAIDEFLREESAHLPA
jgi:proline iminopeptidase